MDRKRRLTEDVAFNLSTGVGESAVAYEDQYFFDIAGFLRFDRLLKCRIIGSILTMAVHFSNDMGLLIIPPFT